MKFADSIDVFVADMRATGRINSDATEVSYRAALNRLADVVSNRDPSYIGREDIKRTLLHWSHPNSRRTNRSILVSFFDWCMEEGVRKDNPARQTRRPRQRAPEVYRLTLDEVQRMLQAAQGPRERRAIFVGICAGLRAKELRGLRGLHFERTGWIWVSSDIAKGGRERWVPIIAELEPIVSEIREQVAHEEYVLPAQRFRDPGTNRLRVDKKLHPCSAQALYYLVKRVGKRAGIAAGISPHLMRHAFGDHVARFVGIRHAQFLLGHAGVSTTETYLGKPTLDELAASIQGFGFRTSVPGGLRTPQEPRGTPTRVQPVEWSPRTVEPEVASWLASLDSRVALYREAFGA